MTVEQAAVTAVAAVQELIRGLEMPRNLREIGEERAKRLAFVKRQWLSGLVGRLDRYPRYSLEDILRFYEATSDR